MYVALACKPVNFKQNRPCNHPTGRAFIYNCLDECRRKKNIKREINNDKGLKDVQKNGLSKPADQQKWYAMISRILYKQHSIIY
jgi:hypothetical protein